MMRLKNCLMGTLFRACFRSGCILSILFVAATLAE